MTEPPVNPNLKAFKDIKGKPATPQRFHYVDWRSKQIAPVDGLKSENLFGNVKDDINSPLKQIGMNPSYMISLPCCEVNDLPNKNPKMGSQTKRTPNAKPFTGMSPIAFSKQDRVGKNGMDIKQRPFTFSSWNSSSCGC